MAEPIGGTTATGEAPPRESGSPVISDARANALALQPDGKIIVAGVGWSRMRSAGDFALARYQPDGSSDPSFGMGGKLLTDVAGKYAEALALSFQSDGKIVVAGSWSSSEEGQSYGEFTLVRYKADGSLDQSFGHAGKVITRIGDGLAIAYALALQSDGKIVVAGTFGGKFVVVRYQANGALDPSFGTAGTMITTVGVSGGATALALQPDGKIIAAGNADDNFALVRYYADGRLDTRFGTGGKVMTAVGARSGALALAFQPDGKIVVAGSADNSFALIRYHADGRLDVRFGTGGTVITHPGPDRPPESGIRALALQRDGKIVVAGYISSSGYIPFMGIGSYEAAIARYRGDGTLDSSFGLDGVVIGGSINRVHDLTLQPDGKIVAAGEALQAVGSSEEAASVFAVARYNIDGSPDVSFGKDGVVNTHFFFASK